MPRMSPLLERIYKNRGLDPDIVSRFEDLESWAVQTIRSLVRHYPQAAAAYTLLAVDEEVRALWEMANYMTVVKLGYNDHGETHAKIAAAYALTILRLLLDANVRPDLISDGLGDEDDAFLVVLTATFLHDIGNQAGRFGHEALSVNLAMPILDRILDPIYPKADKRTRIKACIAHAILSHDLAPPPVTLEAAIVAVGDGADLTKGRGRIAFDLGKVDIHSVSALAIQDVTIQKGETCPVEICVTMSNSAGIFQVEQTLTTKVLNTPLRDLVTVTAVVRPEDEEPVLERITLQRGRFVTQGGAK
jgi:metal-dependent HD superfamily phosphatase/phosphodiesterase